MSSRAFGKDRGTGQDVALCLDSPGIPLPSTVPWIQLSLGLALPWVDAE